MIARGYAPGVYGGSPSVGGGYAPGAYSPGGYLPGGYAPYDTRAQQLDPARQAQRMGNVDVNVDRSVFGEGARGYFDSPHDNPEFFANEGIGLGFLLPLVLTGISAGTMSPAMIATVMGNQALGQGLGQFGEWGINQAPEQYQPALRAGRDVVGAVQSLSGQGDSLNKVMSLYQPFINAWNAIRGNDSQPPPPSSMDLLRAWTAQGDQQRALEDQAGRYNSLMDDSTDAQQMRDIMYGGDRGWGAGVDPWMDRGMFGARDRGRGASGGGRNWAMGGAPLF